MHDRSFGQPVRLYVGLNVEREITSAFQAYTFLNDYFRDRAMPEYRRAREACLAAVSEGRDMGSARMALVAFAERSGILASEAGDVVAAQAPRAESLRISA